MNQGQPEITVSDVKVFVPALDFTQSLQFYTLLGWQIKWQSGSVYELFSIRSSNL